MSDWDCVACQEFLGDGGEHSLDFEASGIAEGNLHLSLIMGTVEPSQWQEETERVAPALRAKMTRRTKESGWVTHVCMLREYGARIQGMKISEGEVDISGGSMVDMISSLQHSLLQGLSGIARVEKMINSSPDFCSIGLAYAKIKQVGIAACRTVTYMIPMPTVQYD